FGLGCLDHRGTDAVTEIPCGFVGTFVLSPESAFKLVRTHALACFHEQEHSHKPNVQRQVGVMEDRLCGHAELIGALATFKLRVVGKLKYFLALATQAFNPRRPTQLYEQRTALFISRKHLSEVFECHG